MRASYSEASEASSSTGLVLGAIGTGVSSRVCDPGRDVLLDGNTAGELRVDNAKNGRRDVVLTVPPSLPWPWLMNMETLLRQHLASIGCSSYQSGEVLNHVYCKENGVRHLCGGRDAG